VKTHSPTPRIYRERDEEPVAVACDFSAVYSLYLRPVKRGGFGSTGVVRILLKVTWEDPASELDGLRSCAFEIDLRRERVVALGRKGNSMPADRLPAKWFCEWARSVLPAVVVPQ